VYKYVIIFIHDLIAEQLVNYSSEDFLLLRKNRSRLQKISYKLRISDKFRKTEGTAFSCMPDFLMLRAS